MSRRASRPLDDGSLFLTDGGMETALIFHQGQELPSFATFPLLEQRERQGRAPHLLRAVPRARADTRGTGFILGGCTWRASADWGAELGYDATPSLQSTGGRSGSSRSCVRARRRRQGPVLLEAPIGPRRDAYAPSSLMSADEAEQYHSAQLQTLSDTPVDLVTALTFTYADEAIGMVRAARAAGLPVAVSFTRRDRWAPAERPDAARRDRAGRRRDGRGAAPLHDQLRAPDPLRRRARRRRAVERADPGPARERLDAQPCRARRRRGTRRRRSRRPRCAARRAARARCPNLTILGGCCGTDIRHVTPSRRLAASA